MMRKGVNVKEEREQVLGGTWNAGVGRIVE